MANIIVHGGDFQKYPSWFYPLGFVLHDLAGKPARIAAEAIVTAEAASAESIRALGGGESLVAELERVPADDRAVTFIVLFGDGRFLLASADPATVAEVCAGRARKVH